MLLFKLRGTAGRAPAFHQVPLRPCCSFRMGVCRPLAGFGVRWPASIFSGLENHFVFDSVWLVSKAGNEVSGGESHLAVLASAPCTPGSLRCFGVTSHAVDVARQWPPSVSALRELLGKALGGLCCASLTQHPEGGAAAPCEHGTGERLPKWRR